MPSSESLLIAAAFGSAELLEIISFGQQPQQYLSASKSLPDLSRSEVRCCVCGAREVRYNVENFSVMPCGHARCFTCSRLGHSCTLCTDTVGGVQKRTAQVLFRDRGGHIQSARAPSVCTRLVPQRSRLKTNGHFSDMMQKFDRRLSLTDQCDGRKFCHDSDRGGRDSDSACRGNRDSDSHRPRASLWSTLRRDRPSGHPPLPPSAVKNADVVSEVVRMSPRFSALRRRQRAIPNQSVLTDGSSDSGEDSSIYSRLNLPRRPSPHSASADKRNSFQLQYPASETTSVNRLPTSADSVESQPCHSREHSCSSLMSMSLADSGCSVSQLTNQILSPSECAGTLDDLDALLPSQRGHIVRRSARCSRSSQYRASRFSHTAAPTEDLSETLKPIYFEVPRAQSRDKRLAPFIGRHQLFEQLSRQLAVQLHQQKQLSPAATAPGTAGCVVTGCVGAGKTSLILQLVQYSCFGQFATNYYESCGSTDETSHYCNVRRDSRIDIEGSSVPYNNGRQTRDSRLLSIEGSSAPAETSNISEHARALASRVVAYHFCQADNAVTLSLPEYVHNLAAQLCQCRHLLVYSRLVQTSFRLRQLVSRDSCWRDPRAALVEGVLQPLCSLWRQGQLDGRLCVVLVDGLVDCSYADDCDDLCTFLAECVADFPPWLKLVATADESSCSSLQQLPLHQISLATSAHTDLCDFIRARIAHSSVPLAANQSSSLQGGGRSRLVEHLTRLSAGSFFFADQCLSLLEDGQLVIKAASFGVLPRTVHQLMQLVFSLRFRTQLAFDAVRPILACCLASACPLTAHQLFECVSVAAGVDGQLVDWQRFVQQLRSLSGLLVCRNDGSYMLVHAVVREWLLQTKDRGEEQHRFCVDVGLGHALLALCHARLGSRSLSGDSALSLVEHVISGGVHLFPQQPTDGTMGRITSDLSNSSCGVWLSWVLSPSDATAALICCRHVYRPRLMTTGLLLAAGADANRPTGAPHAAPILAVVASQQQQQPQLLRMLLRWRGIDVNSVNARGQSVLQLAASAGQLESCRQLLASGARVDLCDSAGRCARVSAAIAGHTAVLDLLLQAGGTRHIARHLFQAILVASSGAGHKHLLLHLIQQQRHLFESEPSLVDSVDTRLSGETALTMSAAAGHVSLCCHLLDGFNASVSAVNRHGAAPLMCAARHGRWLVCGELLGRRGVNVDARDLAGRTALMVAACGGHCRVVRQLLHAGASVDLCDNDGLTALCWASLKSHRSCVLALLDEASPGAAVNHTDNSGRSPLDLAVFGDSAPLVELLLDRGACVERCDGRGVRTLDRAVACASVDVVQCFLRRGAKLANTTWTAAKNKPDILYALLAKLNDDGMLLFRRERVEQAAHRFSYGLNRFPEHEVQQQQAKSQQMFRQLHANLLLNLSRCHRRMGFLKKSEDLATQAMTLVPDAFEPYFFRAKALHAQRRMEAALRDIDRALRLCPKQSHQHQLHSTLLHVRDQLISAAVGSTGSYGDNSSADSAVYSCVE